MKDFIKFTFASMLGMLLAGFAFVILGAVIIASLVLSTGSSTHIAKNSVLVLDLKGTLYERVQENPLYELMGEEFLEYGLDDILNVIRLSKYNANINGIYLQAEMQDASYASLEEIRNALKDFKESGKFVIAYADQYSQPMYYLASVADKVIVNPQGSIEWQGLASQSIFFKDLLEKAGIEMQIFKVGTYKSAVEPYMANEMSDANREQLTTVLNSIWERLLKDVSASRSIPEDVLKNCADDFMAFAPAETYIANGMADTLLYKDGVLNYLKDLTGCAPGETLQTISFEEMKLNQTIPTSPDNIIAVYYAFGDIDASLSPNEGINPEKMITDLRKLREDESVKAVVLRINSPGGSAYGSEQIWREVTLLKEKKPVIVSMGDYAASGGYYIACAADYIVADPTTLTGSIGIFGMFPNLEKLLTDKLSLHFGIVKTNPHADMGDLTRPFTTAEKKAMQDYVNRGYQLFVKRCAEGRGMSVEAIEKIAEGRVWTGTIAQEYGLVDELGGLDKALQIARQRANLQTHSVVHYPSKDDIWVTFINGEKESYIESKMSDALGELYNYTKFIQRLKNSDRIQARMPFDLRIR